MQGTSAQEIFLGMDIPKIAPIRDTVLGADLMNGIVELNDANMDYAKADAYYRGTQPEFFASLRLRIAMGATGVIFNYNFAKLPVDAVAERVEIAAVTSTQAGITEQAAALWEANRLDLHAPDIMRKAALFGDSYVLVWPSDTSDAAVAAEMAGGPEVDTGLATGEQNPSGVDIFYNSPRCMRVIYDNENELVKRYAIKRWRDPNTGYTFVNLYYAERIEKYMQKPITQAVPQPMWEKRIDSEGEPWPLPNPFGEIPVFHFRNGFPYGSPEHKDAYGPQDSIHKLVINHMASVDYNAFPQRYAIMAQGYDTSEAAFGDEGEYSFSLNTGATLDTGVDPKSQLTADPASVWFMRGVQSYGQFEPGDPKAFLGPFIEYIHAMAVVTQTPMHFLDPIVANVSGESLRVIEGPFVKKVRLRQLFMGATWIDVWQFAFKVMGYDRVPIHIAWVPAATVNDLATLQGEMIKLQLGVPAYQILTELGYTDEQLTTWGVEKMSTPALPEADDADDVGTGEEL